MSKDDYSIFEELEAADKKEEQTAFAADAAAILSKRPALRRLFSVMLSLPADKQAAAIRLCTEASKPRCEHLS